MSRWRPAGARGRWSSSPPSLWKGAARGRAARAGGCARSGWRTAARGGSPSSSSSNASAAVSCCRFESRERLAGRLEQVLLETVLEQVALVNLERGEGAQQRRVEE